MYDIDGIKRVVIERLLAEYPMVFVTFDHHHRNAKAPSTFDDADFLTLLWGMSLPVPIRDLLTDENSISGTLSFNRSAFHCVAPWESVICVTLAEGEQPIVAFQPPPALLSKLKGERPAERPKMLSSRRKPPKLQLVRSPDDPKSA